MRNWWGKTTLFGASTDQSAFVLPRDNVPVDVRDGHHAFPVAGRVARSSGVVAIAWCVGDGVYRVRFYAAVSTTDAPCRLNGASPSIGSL